MDFCRPLSGLENFKIAFKIRRFLWPEPAKAGQCPGCIAPKWGASAQSCAQEFAERRSYKKKTNMFGIAQLAHPVI